MHFFFNYGFKLQDYVRNDCHDLTMLSVNISDIAIITVKNIDYRCIIHIKWLILWTSISL